MTLSAKAAFFRMAAVKSKTESARALSFNAQPKAPATSDIADQLVAGAFGGALNDATESRRTSRPFRQVSINRVSPIRHRMSESRLKLSAVKHRITGAAGLRTEIGG